MGTELPSPFQRNMRDDLFPKNRIWKLKPASPLAPRLALETGLDPLQAQLLINRGISDRASARSFMSPRLVDLLDPMLLKDMEPAVETILSALERKEKIIIYGDFDADGTAATALLLRFFRELNVPVSSYIPHRIREGYGLNPRAIERLAGEGCGLLITVDCGVADGEEIALAKRLGLETVVTDHHQVPTGFRPLCPVINPYREDSMFPFRDLAGVGVAFFLAIALRAALRERGWFEESPEPDLKDYLGLVALGTVADMAPLMGQNRILVKAGLERLGADPGIGIGALFNIAGTGTSVIDEKDLAFRIAPRLNASGRMGDAGQGVEILCTENPDRAHRLAGILDELNKRRQAIEQDILRRIAGKIGEIHDFENRRTLVVSGKGWHRGVLGIVASRLKDKYYRPAFVLSIENGMAFGSGRSPGGFNLYGALSKLGPFLVKYGGHPRAAGLTLKSANIEGFSGALEDLMRKETGEEDLFPTVEVDAPLTLPELTEKRISEFGHLAPYGADNPAPLFYAGPLDVVDSRVVGEKHLKLKVKQDGAVREAIGFNLATGRPDPKGFINMIFTPEINRWQGMERIQLRIIDYESADTGKTKLKMFNP
ncbi:MAG: single-stranded-DNA-specific exonuclease RecJ [Pseudomonadota bacterium]